MSERALLAAQGYLDLGMVEEALAELSSFQGLHSQDPDLLELRLHILMQGHLWGDALTAAEELLRVKPDSLPPYIHGAFALHELGRTAEARDLLLKGPSILRKDPTFHYNIGCYEAVLGNRESALRSLSESFALDETFRDFAQRDPDLELLRKELAS
jgi:predicted Zn-dependent protease